MPRGARAAAGRIFPGARAWRSILRALRRDMVDALFAPDIDSVLARLTSEIEELEGKNRHGEARSRGFAEPEIGVAADASADQVSGSTQAAEATRD